MKEVYFITLGAMIFSLIIFCIIFYLFKKNLKKEEKARLTEEMLNNKRDTTGLISVKSLLEAIVHEEKRITAEWPKKIKFISSSGNIITGRIVSRKGDGRFMVRRGRGPNILKKLSFSYLRKHQT